MAKTVLGIDIGYDSMKLALVSGKKVMKTLTVPMPKNLIQDGRTVSVETMGELIRKTLKESGIRSSKGAVVLSSDAIFVRNVTMPQMSVDQLLYNLPFEFRDYITEELKDYVYDYAVESFSEPEPEPPKEGEEGAGGIGADAPASPANPYGIPGQEQKAAKTMDLLAVAVPVSMMDETRQFIRKAGMKLINAAPPICAYINLIRNLPDGKKPESGEYCILDLGFRSVRMYMFKEDRHIVTRVLEIGLSGLDDVIAEAFNVDAHLAHTYLLTNYQDCVNKDYCVNSYNNISVELMRAMNFYRFSNQESSLSDIWICGGGAAIAPLCSAIASSLDLTVHNASELIEGGEGIENCHLFTQAIGIALGQ